MYMYEKYDVHWGGGFIVFVARYFSYRQVLIQWP